MKEYERAVRAAISYAYNEKLLPKVQERLERAEGVLEGYLVLSGKEQARLGPYQVEKDEEGIRIGPAGDDGWEQSKIDWQHEKVHTGATTND
jgi:hypothetical protein